MEYNAIDLGGLYHLSDKVRAGVMLKNAYGFAFKDAYKVFQLPRYLTVAIATNLGQNTLSVDSEYIFGNFSGLKTKRVEIWFLRAGFEREFTPWLTGRIGCIYPVLAETSTLGNIKKEMPWPKIGGALGIGLKLKKCLIDASLYGDPAQSYVAQRPTISSVISVTIPF